MDLGCIDIGCFENQRNESSSAKENSPKECTASASKLGKNNRAKDAIRSSLTPLNRLTSQISKPPQRKTSPLNWFPRKNVEPYLKRKIKMLQEVDGIHSTLDETLGDSHPHYCRVLREKIAIREAAEKAMVALKAAMVEASWCRMLRAARIESKDAEDYLSNVEADAAEAFAAARAAGVIMNDIQGSAGNHYRTESIHAKGGSLTHTVSATFESQLEVDKQVAAAVKAALVKLASFPPVNKDESKELLRKISEIPDTEENCYLPDITSDCESGADPEPEVENANLNSDGARMRKPMEKQKLENIVDIMLGRLQCLKEDELASLATIVAAIRRKITGVWISLGGKTDRRNIVIARQMRSDAELPSLDKFLVKRLTRLERELLEAKNARKKELSDGNNERELDTTDAKFPTENRSSRVEIELNEGTGVSDIASDEVVQYSAKLEMENKVEQSRKSSRTDKEECEVVSSIQDIPELPSLDKFLVKRLSRLEREIIEVKSRNNLDYPEGGSVFNSMETATLAATASEENQFCADVVSECKENLNLNKVEKNHIGRNLSREEILFGDNKNRKEALSGRGGWFAKGESYESLDKVLVKHVSRLEKEKLEFRADDRMGVKLKRKDACTEREICEGSLDQVLVKHKSRLEKEKTAGAGEQDNCKNNEKEALPGGGVQVDKGEIYESLDKVLVKHVSRLEKEKQKIHVDDRMPVKLKCKDPCTERDSSRKSLDQILVQHKSRLERETMAAAGGEQDNSIRHSVSRRDAREKELQEAWGGMSLGDSLRPHVSRLQRDKAAWIEAEAQAMKSTLEE